MAEIFGGIELIARVVSTGFPELRKEIDATEAKVKGLQKTFATGLPPAAQNIVDDEVKNLGILRKAIGQTGDQIEASRKKLLGLSTNLGKVGTTAVPPLTGVAGAFQKITLAIDGADGKLKRFGITTRDISVILGAGLAGGIAFAIRSLIQFGTEIVTLSAKTEQLENISKRAFGEFSNLIEDFSNRAVTSLGLARSQTLEFANALGISFQNIGIAERDAAKLSTTLVTIAVALSRSTAGAKSTAEALDAVRAAVLRQEFDPIENFSIKLKDLDIRQEAVRLGMAKTTKEVDKQGLAIASIRLITGDSELALKALAESEGGLADDTARFSAQLEEVKRSLGDLLLPAVLDFLDTLNALLGPLATVARALSTLSDASGALAEKTNGMSSGYLRLITAIGSLGLTEIIRGLKSLSNNTGDAADEVDRLADSTDLYNAFLNAETGKIEIASEKLEQFADAHKRLARAIAEAERDENAAELALQRTREDSVRKIADANRDIKRAYRDRNRAIADANEKMSDVELQNFRAIRDAEEKLSDARKDNAKKVDKAEEDLAEARQARNDAILQALIAVSDAQFAFDTQSFNRAQRELTEARDTDTLKDARKNLSDTIAETEEDLARLERDLAEERIDAIERVSDAKADQARAFEDANEKIADAERRRGEVEIEVNRALFDAQTRLEEARRRGTEAVADARERFEELKLEIGDTAERVKVLTDQLNNLKDVLLDPVFQTAPEFAPEGSGRSGIDDWLNPGNAAGGPVYAGKMGWVGERGPELFIPNQNGQIISNDVVSRLIAALNSGRGGGGGNSIVVYEAADPDATAFAVEARMMRGIHN